MRCQSGKGQPTADSGPGRSETIIREMEVDDIPAVFHLGNQLFHGARFTTLYRTWDAFEVTTAFNQDPELCLVAEERDRIVGFALGTTYEKEQPRRKYGCLLWLGVDPASQGCDIGKGLYLGMEHRMCAAGAVVMLVTTARPNTGAIKFFERMGFGRPRYEVWLSKTLPAEQGVRAGRRGSPFSPAQDRGTKRGPGRTQAGR